MAEPDRPAPDELEPAELLAASVLSSALGEVDPKDAELLAAINLRDPAMAANALDYDSIRLRINADLLPVLVDEYRTVVLDELTRLPIADFDPTRYARLWAEEHAGRMIVEITESTRLAVVDVVKHGLGRGLGIDPIAAAIRRDVGLHSRYALAVEKRHALMLAEGMSRPRADKLAARYAAKLRRTRSITIARWEVQSARNSARYQTWEESYRVGGVPVGARKKWVVATPCDACAALAAEDPVPWNMPFSNGKLMPPEHPRCKCTASIVAP